LPGRLMSAAFDALRRRPSGPAWLCLMFFDA
jgi:hypothetical protein